MKEPSHRIAMVPPRGNPRIFQSCIQLDERRSRHFGDLFSVTSKQPILSLVHLFPPTHRNVEYLPLLKVTGMIRSSAQLVTNVMCPVYGPTSRPTMLTDTVMSADVKSLAGDAEGHDSLAGVPKFRHLHQGRLVIGGASS